MRLLAVCLRCLFTACRICASLIILAKSYWFIGTPSADERSTEVLNINSTRPNSIFHNFISLRAREKEEKGIEIEFSFSFAISPSHSQTKRNWAVDCKWIGRKGNREANGGEKFQSRFIIQQVFFLLPSSHLINTEKLNEMEEAKQKKIFSFCWRFFHVRFVCGGEKKNSSFL